MPRKVRSPKQTSPNTYALLETCSEPDLSPATSATEADPLTRKSSKRFRGDDSCTQPDRIDELKDLLESWKADQDIILNKLMAEVAELKLQNLTIHKTNLEIEKSIQFLGSKFEDMKARLETLEGAHREYERRLHVLADSGSQQIVAKLEEKIDSMEQQARQCNIEICNLPEKRNENLLTIVETVGQVVNWPVPQSDIVSVHRVPHAQQHDSKPKNVVLKLRSRIIRDNLLSAYRKTKSIKSHQLGISGTSMSVYLNEHLTLKNKSLFREAKKIAAKNGFRYVWIRNATILVRERDGSSAFAIRSEDDLRRIVSGGKRCNEHAI